MNYVDTHTHLYDEQIMTEIDAVIDRAIGTGVHKMYMPNCDSSTIEGMMNLARKWPEHCFPMMGLHPCYVKDNYKEELALVERHLSEGKFYAVGEIGLDYYWDMTFQQEQIEAFKMQIDWALQYNLPIVIHSRESTRECIDIVKEKQNGALKGIFHCFSGTAEEAQEIAETGLFLGIGGVVTFKKSGLAEVVEKVPLEYMVLETDSPYLAPVPYRGKRNESSYIPLVAAKIAEVKGVDINLVAEVTTRNAEKIFTN